MARRRNTAPFRTKSGKYGTLYRYQVRYQDVTDSDIGGTWAAWAYDVDHALDLFYSAPDADGWETVGTPKRARVRV